jgi:hypothetical protein
MALIAKPIKCDVSRPCAACVTRQESKRPTRLTGMKCIVHKVSTLSILALVNYSPVNSIWFMKSDKSDSSRASRNRIIRSNSYTNQNVNLDREIPPRIRETLSLDDLAGTFAHWISGSYDQWNSQFNEVAVLCSPLFQSIAGPDMGESMIQVLRLLLLASTLFYCAVNGFQGSTDSQITRMS